jgi:hypothetical protein
LHVLFRIAAVTLAEFTVQLPLLAEVVGTQRGRPYSPLGPDRRSGC